MARNALLFSYTRSTDIGERTLPLPVILKFMSHLLRLLRSVEKSRRVLLYDQPLYLLSCWLAAVRGLPVPITSCYAEEIYFSISFCLSLYPRWLWAVHSLIRLDKLEFYFRSAQFVCVKLLSTVNEMERRRSEREEIV